MQKINDVFGKGLSMVQIYQSCLTYRINLQTLEDPFNSVVVVFVVRKSMFTHRSASLYLMYFFKWCYIQLQAFHNNYYIECPDYFEWLCFVVVVFFSCSVSIKLVLVARHQRVYPSIDFYIG